MKYFFSIICFFILFSTSQAQVEIHELDCDSQSIDDKEFIELKSDTPNYALNNLVLVFFNGSNAGGNKSYYAIDLDTYSTDINGIFLIGSSSVSPSPQLLIPPNVIQNGADAVGLYQASLNDVPEGTLATTTNLIDALAYDTGDADATSLMSLLGLTIQIDEDANNNKDIESIQRATNGTYFVATPTPRALNDGSGIDLNGITITTNATEYTEGDTFNINFSTEQPVTTSALNFNISLQNGNFTTNDYSGTTTISIPVGASSVSTTITLTDDSMDEGDEELLISIGQLPDEYIPLNTSILIRIYDNDFVVSPWGTPTNPTFGNVQSTQTSGYYNNLDEKAGQNLRQALQDIIADQTLVRAQTYADVISILKEADQNPAHSNQVWLAYTEEGRAKLDLQTSSINTGKWNREHTYPRSRGGFYSIEEDDVADGKSIFWTTNADSLRHGNSDAHALRAVAGPENSSRGNQNYGSQEYDGPNGNAGSFKGDVARSVFYMAIRYNNLSVINGYPSANNAGELGDLATLLQWHQNDPPDDFEMNRNNVVYTWQKNRNPFIDQPELVDYIWGNKMGQVWEQELVLKNQKNVEVKIYPNPTNDVLHIQGLKGNYQVEIFTLTGKELVSYTGKDKSKHVISLAKGTYLVKINQNTQQILRKLIVK